MAVLHRHTSGRAFEQLLHSVALLLPLRPPSLASGVFSHPRQSVKPFRPRGSVPPTCQVKQSPSFTWMVPSSEFVH